MSLTNMVRIYLLNDSQRAEIQDYLENRILTQNMRSIRFQCRKVDFDLMKADMDLIEQLNAVKLKRGRKPETASVDQYATFTVRKLTEITPVEAS